MSKLNLPDLPEPYFWRVVEVSSGPACLSAQIVYPKGRRGKRVGVWAATQPIEAKYIGAIENHAAGIAAHLRDIRSQREIANDLVGDYRREVTDA